MKKKAGFTLLEAVIALAVWLILSVSAIYMWHHVSTRTNAVLARQNALENARVAMDALTVNIQMARSITLYVGPDFDLRYMYLISLNPQQAEHTYRFIFDYRLRPAAGGRFQSLQLTGRHNGYSNHIAHDIYKVKIEPDCYERQLDITVTTACMSIVLENSVDIRYKYFNMTQWGTPNNPQR